MHELRSMLFCSGKDVTSDMYIPWLPYPFPVLQAAAVPGLACHSASIVDMQQETCK